MTYRATITTPTGEVIDVTELMDLDELGTVSQELEADLTAMTHADFDVVFDNSTGEIEAVFENAAPTDAYEFVLEREREDGDGWDRVFAGVIDLATSLVYDESDEGESAGVTVFSFSKMLERASAVEIIRSVATKTASIGNGGRTLTLVTGTYSDVRVGDQVEIDDGDDNRQTFTVDIVGSTTLTTVETADQAYTAATLVIVTPFHRDKTPAQLLALIAAHAALDAPGVVAQALATYPVATPMAIDGLNRRGIPLCFTPSGGFGSVVFKGATYARKKTDGPANAWQAWAGASNPLVDWTAYLDAEPVTIGTNGAGVGDVGALIKDHLGNTYEISFEQGGGSTFLRVFKNASIYVTLDTFVGVPATPYRWVRYDRATLNNELWYSFVRADNSKTEFGWVDLGSATINVKDATTVGSLRYCRQRDVLMVLREGGATAEVYAMGLPTPRTKVATIDLPSGAGMADWYSLHAVGPTGTAPFLAWISRGPTGLGTYVTIADANAWTFVTSYKISDLNCMVDHTYQRDQATVGGVRSHLCRFPTATETVVMGYAGGEWIVVGMTYAGVVRYADFSDMSCAKAAREVAIVLNSLIAVDNFKTLTLINRIAIGTGDPVAELGVPFQRQRRPVSEIYRQSVRVSGADEQGNEISVVVGDPGASASRLEIESTLATNEALLAVIGASTLAFVSAVREQVDATFEDADEPLVPFDAVTTEGTKYVVYSAKTDLGDGEHDLVLLGLTA